MPALVIGPQKRLASLRITVVGGSIAGLATAYALQKAGHSVVIVEQSDGKARSHGGLRCPPNMTKILNYWGLGPTLAKFGTKCPQFVFHKGETGDCLGIIPLHEEFLRDLVADYMFIQHGDLYSMLYDLAVKEGVELRFNSKVTRVDSPSISVTLDNGETLFSDIVVGADGSGSSVRSEVLGEKISETPDQQLTLTLSISIADMRKDEDLRSFTESTEWNVWLGSGYMVHGMLISSKTEYCLVVCLHLLENAPATYNDNWTLNYTLDHFNIDVNRFEPRVVKLLELAQRCTPNVYLQRPLLASSVCDRARIALVGEAAHPIMPCGQHNTALAIEDAEVLGNLFSRIQHVDEVPRMLAAYEDIRQTRCNSAEEWEIRKRAMLTLPSGPMQRARDKRLRKSMACADWERLDERTFWELWGDELAFFTYDAMETVQDWWTKWGAVLTRETGGVPTTPILEVSVSSGERKYSSVLV